MKIKNAHVVIESIDSKAIGIHVFDNSPRGLEEAKTCFVELAREQREDEGICIFSDSEIETGYENGFLWDGQEDESWTVSVHIAD